VTGETCPAERKATEQVLNVGYGRCAIRSREKDCLWREISTFHLHLTELMEAEISPPSLLGQRDGLPLHCEWNPGSPYHLGNKNRRTWIKRRETQDMFPRERTMGYSLIADVIVAVHVAYVGYVVIGQLFIWLGLAFRWRWVRNPWFRWTHLIMMGIVGAEAILNIECPLTHWERDFRGLAGQETSGTSFVGRLLHNLIFVDWPLWVLNSSHVAFALVVLATFVLAPPRRRVLGSVGKIAPS
jgi:hypothetical protein